MKTENSNQTTLVYQKQLLLTIQRIVDFRTQLLKDVSLIANEGKNKDWPSDDSQLKFAKRQIDKSSDQNLKFIASILRTTEEPVLQLEKNLELKNDFKTVISNQSIFITNTSAAL